jgi:ferritin-like metal-binding protein YciE
MSRNLGITALVAFCCGCAILLTLIGVDSPVKDAALILAAQQVEHFEIATHNTLRTWAVALDQREAMEALDVTLEEETNADTRLAGIAETLNLRAVHAR